MKANWIVAPLFVASLIFSACNMGGQNAQNGAIETDTVDEASCCKAGANACCAELLGTYKATLPCADCSGLATTLVLLPEGKFTLVQVVEGTEPVQKFDYDGTVTVDKEKMLLTLTSTQGEVFYIAMLNGKLVNVTAEAAQLLPQYTETEMTQHNTFTKVEVVEAAPEAVPAQ